MSYFYGPVPSRRLGLSLGVDVVPAKVCSFDCIYCQVGVTTTKSLRRFFYVDLDKFRKELKDILRKQPKIDYITFSGSGEPTLHKNLDKIIRITKEITQSRYPVCVITNSSLLYRKDVRRELKQADLIIPSLDAASSKNFYKINRPAAGITFKKVIDGLIALRREFKGKIWLEIMLIANINDSVKEAKGFKRIIEKIAPDKVQLNLPVRPTPVKLKLPTKGKLSILAKIIDFNIEVAESFHKNRQRRFSLDAKEQIIRYLRRRPATLDDLRRSLGLDAAGVNKDLRSLVQSKKIKQYLYRGKKYFCCR
ncbi:MAG: radical SAM protein [Candidatus Omnitrophota bacterium]|nr:MAG: radical SAM protein [Candidatus Omnitrophota bacterium]